MNEVLMMCWSEWSKGDFFDCHCEEYRYMGEFIAQKNDVDPLILDRIGKIRSELISSCFGLHDEETFLFTFLDYIHLLLQPTPESPLAFSLWNKDRCIFSSFRDLYYTSAPYHLSQSDLKLPSESERIKILEDRAYWLVIHKVATDAIKAFEKKRAEGELPKLIGRELQNKLLPVAKQEYRNQVDLLLHGDREGGGPRLCEIGRYRDLLDGAFKITERSFYPQRCLPDKIKELDFRQEMSPLLESFRSVLDEVFTEINNGLLEDSIPKLKNIFCVVRTIQSNKLRLNSFPYTASLLLSNRQRELFSDWCMECGKVGCKPTEISDGTCLECLETPLGLNSRSAADVTFCSGIIDFGRQPNDRVWDRVDDHDVSEQRRVAIEKVIYPKPDSTDGSADAGSQRSLYYVPVHVNGIPWLILFTFTSLDEEERWDHNFSFYRSATQRTLSYLRWRAEEAYTDELVSAAFGQGVSWEWQDTEIRQRINHIWHIAARVFPFPRFTLHCRPASGEVDENTAPLPNIPGRKERWAVEIDEELTYFGPRQVEWGKTNNQSLLQKLLKKMASRISAWGQISSVESARAAAYVSHTLITPMDELNYYLTFLPEDENKNAIQRTIDRLQETTMFAMAMINSKHRRDLTTEMELYPAQDFLKFVKDEFKAILEQSSKRKIFGDEKTEEVVKQLMNQRRVEVAHEWQNIRCEIAFHPTQIRMILREAIENAAKRLIDTDLYFRLRLLEPKSNGVFVEVVNSTTTSPHDLESDVARAESGSADLLGVTNIRQACDVLHFNPPEWFQEVSPKNYAVMGLRVQIGQFH